jgi:hypothetical protein
MTNFKKKYFHLILGLQAFFKDTSSTAFEGLKVKILDLAIYFSLFGPVIAICYTVTTRGAYYTVLYILILCHQLIG